MEGRYPVQPTRQVKKNNFMDDSMMHRQDTSKEGNKATKKITPCSRLHDFCGYTACHGLGRIVGSAHLPQKFLWLLLFAGALGVAAFQLRLLFMKYQSRPVSTSIKVKTTASLSFPTISICNLNPVRKSQLPLLRPEDYAYIMTLLKPDESKSRENSSSQDGKVDEGSGNLATSTMSSTSNSTDEQGVDQSDNENEDPGTERRKRNVDGQDAGNPDDSQRSDQSDNGTTQLTDDPLRLSEKLSVMLAQMHPDKSAALGHQFAKTVYSCTFRGHDCLKREYVWTTFWHYKYGNCFTFNPKQDAKPTLVSNKAGPDHGLTLRLFVDQSDYIGQLSQEAGMRVAISPPGPMPFPYEEGISVPPGFAAEFGIKKKVIKRVDPFNNNSCHDKEAIDNNNVFLKSFSVAYSKTACMESCLAYNQLKSCDCMETRFPAPLGTNMCDSFNDTVVGCLDKVQTLFRNSELNCSKECQPACREEYYKITQSTTMWPSKNYESFLENTLDISLDGKKINIRENFLKVRVFYEGLDYEELEETISYQLLDFVSDTGGQLGLWLGVSVLAGAEVLELLLLIALNLCGVGKKRETGTEDEIVPL